MFHWYKLSGILNVLNLFLTVTPTAGVKGSQRLSLYKIYSCVLNKSCLFFKIVIVEVFSSRVLIWYTMMICHMCDIYHWCGWQFIYVFFGTSCMHLRELRVSQHYIRWNPSSRHIGLWYLPVPKQYLRKKCSYKKMDTECFLCTGLCLYELRKAKPTSSTRVKPRGYS